MRRFMSREVERVATRKSLVFILRIEGKSPRLCTKCVQYAEGLIAVKLFLPGPPLFLPLARSDDDLRNDRIGMSVRLPHWSRCCSKDSIWLEEGETRILSYRRGFAEKLD